jgi:SAM-dependent methyltransferase
VSTEERRQASVAQVELAIERARGFSGWDFPGVELKRIDPMLPWDYEAIAGDRLRTARTVLDLGTGGGEVLSRVAEGAQARILATEEWSVNAPIAGVRLAALGMPVLRADSLRLPFGAGVADLVLDRHEALDPAEIARVLAPGGTVVTQQCGPDDWPELRRFFPRKTVFGDHYAAYQQGFRDGGLRIEQARWNEARVAFASLHDLVYMLMVAPWYLSDFDPVAEIDTLLELEDALRTDDGIVLSELRYLIVATKPPE